MINAQSSVFTLLLGLIFSWHVHAGKSKRNTNLSALGIYQQMKANGENLPPPDVFAKAFQGYQKLWDEGKCKRAVLAIVDFRRSSNQKRLWIIDMYTYKTLHHTWVSHGQGNEFAKEFSNIPNSHQSSLGFYITQQTYYGKHGLSLRLQGIEKGFNHHALSRSIVMQGAAYVSPEFIKRHGRLGRSYGCPAVPQTEHKEIIEALKDQACLFLYYPDKEYEMGSELI